nr:PAAR domain-containing protein [uncultured Rhodopila sp.]
MGLPAARVTDMQVCPMMDGIVPHVGGPISLGCFTVLVCAMPQARISDMHVCVGPPGTMVAGSPTVLVGGMPASRVGDSTAHGGTVVGPGAPTVLIG